MTQKATPPSPLVEELHPHEKHKRDWQKFFDIVLLVGYLACLPSGAFPAYVNLLSLVLLFCIAVSFFNDNIYLYAALFMFMRYTMLIGETPVFRLYTYIMVFKFLVDLPKLKFRVTYLPALFVFALHSIFAFGMNFNMRQGLNVIVDCLIIYVILMKVLADKTLLRKFMLLFILGGLSSGVYGWTCADVAVDINIRGGGNETVNRNFGSLSDANFAGMFYACCFYTALLLKKIPLLLRFALAAVFGLLILQTASLSALLTLAVLGVLVIILKYRKKSIIILLVAFTVIALLLAFLLSIPQFRQIPVVAGLLLRFAEKFSYIEMGRMDLLTTNRSAIWADYMEIFQRKGLLSQLFGGNVSTVMFIDESTFPIAAHQSILQALVNFGIVGLLAIYIPYLLAMGYRVVKHFANPAGEDEDVAILRILFPMAFLIFGMSVDFFLDWPYLFFYFF